jgi:uncharacterized protein (UPF0276 family)
MEGAQARTAAAAVGVGLRAPHAAEILATRPAIGWLELHPENYFANGPALAQLDAIARDHRLSVHGVGLSLGSADGVDRRHLARLRALVERLAPFLVSEHLSWSVNGGVYLSDLLPLPLTEEALGVVVSNVARAQDALRRRILVENPSAYLRFRHSTIAEPEFLAALAERTGCGLLCDVNNIFVSAANLGCDAEAWLDAVPAGAVSEIHLAGHAEATRDGLRLLIDDHGSPVAPPVWALYARALRRFGPVPSLIEWDKNLPPLAVLLDEARLAEAMVRGALPNDVDHSSEPHQIYSLSPPRSGGEGRAKGSLSLRGADRRVDAPPSPYPLLPQERGERGFIWNGAETADDIEPPPLAALQASFRRALLGDDSAGLAAVIADAVAPQARIEVHRNNLLASLMAVLREAFPVVRRLVDERFFTYAAHSFIRDFPPERVELSAYGGGFAEFLAGFAPCRDLAYLPDVARLEWLMSLAAHADDAAPLPASALSQIAPADTPRLSLALHRSFGFIASPWPIERIWRVNHAGEDAAIDLGAGGDRLEIRRAGAAVMMRRLAAPDFAFRRALGDGKGLRAAAEAALAEDRSFDLAAALRALFRDDAVTAIALVVEDAAQ